MIEVVEVKNTDSNGLTDLATDYIMPKDDKITTW
jgi:hypothetical protein